MESVESRPNLQKEKGIEVYRKKYDELSLRPLVKEIRGVVERVLASTEQSASAQNGLAFPKAFTQLHAEGAITLPTHVEYRALGSESIVFKLTIDKTEYALKIFKTTPTNLSSSTSFDASTNWDDLTKRSSIDEVKLLDEGQDVASLRKVVAFSDEVDQNALLTEFINGQSVLDLQQAGEHPALAPESLSRFVNDIFHLYRRGLIVDPGPNNYLFTAEEGIKILEILNSFNYGEADEEEKKLMLGVVYSALYEVLKTFQLEASGRSFKDTVIEQIRKAGFEEESKMLESMKSELEPFGE